MLAPDRGPARCGGRGGCGGRTRDPLGRVVSVGYWGSAPKGRAKMSIYQPYYQESAADREARIAAEKAARQAAEEADERGETIPTTE